VSGEVLVGAAASRLHCITESNAWTEDVQLLQPTSQPTHQRTQSTNVPSPPTYPVPVPIPAPVPVPALTRTYNRTVQYSPLSRPRGDIRMPILAKPVLVGVNTGLNSDRVSAFAITSLDPRANSPSPSRRRPLRKYIEKRKRHIATHPRYNSLDSLRCLAPLRKSIYFPHIQTKSLESTALGHGRAGKKAKKKPHRTATYE
jgi:hypothetical protein